MNTRLILVDAFGQIFRAYFAFAGKPLINPQGKNVNALFGFYKTLFQIVREYNPTHLAVVYDSKTPTFRHEMYDQYKAQRAAAPDDLLAQLPEIEEILRVLNVPMLQKDGFEADDLIATVATYCTKNQIECFILSNDKDLLQLVGESVRALRSDGKGGYRSFGTQEVLEDKGILPEQINDWLALVGDTADNIPGVAGIGEVSAVKLLTQFKSLDGIYEHLDEVTSASWKKKLLEGKDRAYLSQKLAALRTDVECGFTLDTLKLEWENHHQAADLFLNQNAKSIASQVLSLAGESSSPKSPMIQESLSIQPLMGTYEAVLTLEALEQWVSKMKTSGLGAFDFETDSLDPITAKLCGLSLSCASGSAAYIPFILPQELGKEVDCLGESQVLEAFRPLWEDPDFKIIGQNFKFDAKLLYRRGIRLGRVFFDTMVAAWLLDANANTFNLETLGIRYLGVQGLSFDQVVPKNQNFSQVSLEQATKYSSEDSDLTFRLYECLQPLLKKEGLDELFQTLEMPLTLLLARMELEGIGLETQALYSYSNELEKRLTDVQEEIFSLCGGKRFNLSSPKQLQEILFVDRQLTPPARAKIKTGWSTDSDILEELSLQDPVAGKILIHRGLSKLKSTYVDTLPQIVNKKTGRVHTQFLQTGTATGRLSSKDPNLQNIPIRDEDGRRIRQAFIPAPGCVFVSADYSQIELVVLAHLSGDPHLSRAFIEGKDVHKSTAALMFGVMEELVSADMRRAAKAINFGIMYGMSAFRLGNELKIPRKKAQELWDTYQKEFEGVQGYFQRVIQEAEKDGFVTTMLGHRRVITNINGRNRNEKSAAERIAMNTPIQGSASDIVKLAMQKVDHRLEKEKLKSKIILQVHDELLLECPKEEVDKVKTLLKEEMEGAIKLKVPLKVSIEVGENWGVLH